MKNICFIMKLLPVHMMYPLRITVPLFEGISVYRETVRIKDIYSEGRLVRHSRWPVNVYATIIDKKGSSDVSVNCPNCGYPTMASRLLKDVHTAEHSLQ